MKYTEEEIENAIRLAEQLAKAEMNKKTFKKQGYENLVDMAHDSIGRCHEKLLIENNQLAEQLLPQARIVVKMESDRETALLNTPLGELINAIDRQACIEDGTASGDNSAPFKCYIINMGWDDLLTALKNGEKSAMLEALGNILSHVKCDLVETELPPTAPQYQL